MNLTCMCLPVACPISITTSMVYRWALHCNLQILMGRNVQQEPARPSTVSRPSADAVMQAGTTEQEVSEWLLVRCRHVWTYERLNLLLNSWLNAPPPYEITSRRQQMVLPSFIHFDPWGAILGMSGWLSRPFRKLWAALTTPSPTDGTTWRNAAECSL
jgi:hypothetical protein